MMSFPIYKYDNMEAITEEQARNLILKTKEVFGKVGLDFYLKCWNFIGSGKRTWTYQR